MTGPAVGGPATSGSPEGAGSVGEVLELYEHWAGERYDETVTQLDHALQTAALAARDAAPEALVVAALLHDVGHLLDLAATAGVYRPSEADLRHEHRGARHLSTLFPPEVTTPIELHVEAKRYLSAVDEGYAQRLSAGSIRSLELQGGPLDEAQAERFLQVPGARAAIQLRRWDDAGKVDGLHVAPLEHYAPLLERVSLR